MAEFELIYQQIAPLAGGADDVLLGIGDDAAVLQVPEGYSLVSAMDTLVEGRHFFAGIPADDIAWKALAVNLSDLAAMGAVPRWALLSLSLPSALAQSTWLAAFMAGWHALAQHHHIVLVGGDTTASEQLVVSVTVMGLVPHGQALTRSGAVVGDDLWISGQIGDAGLALACYDAQQLPGRVQQQRLHRPEPRVLLGQTLRGIASAAMDISDGFLADLAHLLSASGGVGASCQLDQFVFSHEVAAWHHTNPQALYPLVSGDDYELLFSAPVTQRSYLFALAAEKKWLLQRVGQIIATPGIRMTQYGQEITLPQRRGFDHFIAPDIMPVS